MNAAVIIIIILLILVYAGVTYYFVFYKPSQNFDDSNDSSDSGDSKSDNSNFDEPDKPTTLPEQNDLVCESQDSKSEAKRYYETEGQFARQYTMMPKKSVQRSDTECDIRYTYTNILNPNITGDDWRTFTYQENDRWVAMGMGAHKSGTMAV